MSAQAQRAIDRHLTWPQVDSAKQLIEQYRNMARIAFHRSAR
jgi:hypothetical protein